jgi:hypothetical protein
MEQSTPEQNPIFEKISVLFVIIFLVGVFVKFMFL